MTRASPPRYCAVCGVTKTGLSTDQWCAYCRRVTATSWGHPGDRRTDSRLRTVCGQACLALTLFGGVGVVLYLIVTLLGGTVL